MHSSGAVAVLQDLIFETKLRSTAKTLGVSLRVVRAVSGEIPAAGLYIVDLNTAADPIETVRRLRQGCAGARIVAYVSHVDEQLASAARAAGADETMPRSRFDRELPRILELHGGRAVAPDPAI